MRPLQRRTKDEMAKLVRQLVDLVPVYPAKLTLWQIQTVLQSRHGIEMHRPSLAVVLKHALRDRRIARVGPRGYTKPTNAHERALAASYVKPKPLLSHPRHNATPGLRTQLAQANAALAAQLLKGASDENNF